jgi:SAM-dependent methyltransferase
MPCPAGPDEEVTHLDCRSLPHVEQIWDLDRFPYPFADNSFDRVLAQDVLEHLQDVRRAVEEIWRISRPGARLTIRVPHWSSFLAHRDPTHQAFFDQHSFDYFGAGPYSYYSHARLRLVSLHEQERYPRLFRFLRRVSPRLVRGLKKHLLDMTLLLTFEFEIVKD